MNRDIRIMVLYGFLNQEFLKFTICIETDFLKFIVTIQITNFKMCTGIIILRKKIFWIFLKRY
jgi:hypothetical protein